MYNWTLSRSGHERVDTSDGAKPALCITGHCLGLDMGGWTLVMAETSCVQLDRVWVWAPEGGH